MQTETIDKLYLELSQITRAKTSSQLAMEKQIEDLRVAVAPFVRLVKSTSGRIPTERLSLENWYKLVKAYNLEMNDDI